MERVRTQQDCKKVFARRSRSYDTRLLAYESFTVKSTVQTVRNTLAMFSHMKFVFDVCVMMSNCYRL
jgi:hypothetical protein